MKNILIALALLGGISYGQDLASSVDDIAGNNRSFTDMQIGTVFKDVPIEGTPYMDEVYRMGIASVNGKEIRLLMRYDAFNDQIELKDKLQKSFNLLRREDIGATIDGKTYKVISYLENGEKKLGYVNPLNSGKVVLYFKPRKVFVQAMKPENGYNDYVPPKYKDNHTYFMQRGNATAEEVRLAKGAVLKFLRDKAPAVKKFVSENRLKLKTETEVVQLLNYYNSL